MNDGNAGYREDGKGAAAQYQDLSLFELPASLRGRSRLGVQLWWIVQSLLFNTSPQACFAWRRAILRLFGAKIGNHVLIRPSVRVTYPWKLTIGDYSWIGDFVELYTLDKILIGRSVVISQGSYICTGTHDFRKLNFAIKTAPVTIEDEVWIASEVFVVPGRTIGKGAVIGVRSLVLEDIPAGAIATGHPAAVRGWRRPHRSATG